MNVPIKIIGIATAFLWLFLIVFSVSAALSMRDVHFSFGDLQIILASNNKLQLSLPVSIDDGGDYNVRYFNITSIVRDDICRVIGQGSTFVDTIRPGQNVSTTHAVVVNLTDLLRNDRNLLFQDSEITVEEHIGMTLAGLLPVGAITNVSVPWGAPLYNFTLESPEFRSFNTSYVAVAVPLSFENHAKFEFAGTIQTRMYSSAGEIVTQNNTEFNVTQNSYYQGFLNLFLPASEVSPSGHFEVLISTSFMNFGPEVIPYG